MLFAIAPTIQSRTAVAIIAIKYDPTSGQPSLEHCASSFSMNCFGYSAIRLSSLKIRLGFVLDQRREFADDRSLYILELLANHIRFCAGQPQS